MKVKSKKPFLALLLIIILLVFVNISYIRVSKMIEQECLNRLFTSSVTTERLMTEAFENNYKVLENISQMILRYHNYNNKDGFEILETFSDLLLTDRTHLLLPNGDDFNNNGIVTNVSGKISFELESSLGKHISKRITSIINDNEQIVRQYVPVITNGETVALLYSTNACNNFSKFITQVDGFKSAHYAIIERNTGNFIYDDMHEDLSNINNYRNRNIPDDSAYIKSIDAILNGEQGYKKVRSPEGSHYNFITYIPSEINDWTFIAMVDEAEILEEMTSYHREIIFFCVISIILFMLYLYLSHRENIEKRETVHAKYELLQQRNDEIIRALSNDFSSVFYVDVEQNKIIPYRTSKSEVKQLVNKVLNTTSYSEFLTNFVTNCVSDDEKLKILYSCSIENIKNQLSKYQSISLKYLNTENRYYVIKLSRADFEDGRLKSFVIGLADRNDEIRKEKKSVNP